jgi:hypothetical protein
MFILVVLWLIANLLHYFVFRSRGEISNPVFCLSAKWIKDEEEQKKNSKKENVK